MLVFWPKEWTTIDRIIHTINNTAVTKATQELK